jgi:DNA polymerase
MNLRETTEAIDMIYGPPMGVVSDCLRGFIVADKGKDLIAMDLAQIEARMIAWLAGEERVLDLFRREEDLYVDAATRIFNVAAKDVDFWKRLVGKVAVLALGFGGGVGAFQQMAKGYNVTMAPAFDSLWSSALFDRRERVTKGWLARGGASGLSRQEWMACELTKVAWREANTHIVSYWKQLEDAAIATVCQPGRTVAAGPAGRQVKYRTNGSFLWCQLPSKRVICYPYPKVEAKETDWGQTKATLTYMAEDSETRKWERVKAYGGLLSENVTQACARDVLAEKMVLVEAAGYPIVFHVHDEFVSEISTGFGSISELEKIMTKTPEWAEGLPIGVDGWRGKRYRKG